MADEILKRDQNSEPVIGLVTDDASKEIRMGRIDDTTKGLKVMLVGGAGAGTVTSVSVATANGFSGTVANATTTPAITIIAGAITPTVSVTTPLVIETNNAITATANAATVPVTSSLSTVTNNSAATLTITITTAGAVSGQKLIIKVLDFSAAAQTLTLVNTENSTVTAPATTNGSTTLPLTIGLMFNDLTTKWRIVAVV